MSMMSTVNAWPRVSEGCPADWPGGASSEQAGSFPQVQQLEKICGRFVLTQLWFCSCGPCSATETVNRLLQNKEFLGKMQVNKISSNENGKILVSFWNLDVLQTLLVVKG